MEEEAEEEGCGICFIHIYIYKIVSTHHLR